MALTRPALAILGISLNFARAHPKEIVVAVADAIYRTAASKYHPDKGVDVVPLPDGVSLTELQEARDAMRANPAACIKEIGRGEQTSREGKRAGDLAERVSALEEMDAVWSHNVVTLWDFIARKKLGLKTEEKKMEGKVVTYSTLHLNGVAILVAAHEAGKDVFYEYLRHNDTWFKRPMARASFTKKSPCPPGIPPELILENSAVGAERGNFYDQSGPHAVPEGFEVLGSYTKEDLAKARAQRRKAKGQKKTANEDVSPAISGGWSFKTVAPGLDPLVANALVPNVSVGAVLQTVLRGAEGSVQYSASGVIMGIRVFDQKQRP